jgi:hypothetical protein
VDNPLRSGPVTRTPGASDAPLRRRAEQIVRFARPNILFYDEHVIDLYHRTCALYRMGRINRSERLAKTYPTTSIRIISSGSIDGRPMDE